MHIIIHNNLLRRIIHFRLLYDFSIFDRNGTDLASLSPILLPVSSLLSIDNAMWCGQFSTKNVIIYAL
jgi:hypothetical protein